MLQTAKHRYPLQQPALVAQLPSVLSGRALASRHDLDAERALPSGRALAPGRDLASRRCLAGHGLVPKRDLGPEHGFASELDLASAADPFGAVTLTITEAAHPSTTPVAVALAALVRRQNPNVLPA